MKKRIPFVSLCIINFNGYELTKECIESLLKTTYPRFEIIVVDNQSTDASFRKLKATFKNQRKVRFIRAEENGYVAGGYNVGASIAKGDYYVFLNNDVTVEPSWLQELMRCATINIIVQPKTLSYWKRDEFDNVGGKLYWPGFGFRMGTGEKDHGQYDTSREVDFAHATIFLFSKQIFKKLHGLDGWFKTHYEDVDACLRVRKFGGHGYYCHKSIVYHKGSWTYKHKTPSTVLVYHVRKNRLRTIIKNYTGIDMLLRLTATLLIYTAFIVQDFLLLQPKHAKATLSATKDGLFTAL